jgi:hypothetical protein
MPSSPFLRAVEFSRSFGPSAPSDAIEQVIPLTGLLRDIAETSHSQRPCHHLLLEQKAHERWFALRRRFPHRWRGFAFCGLAGSLRRVPSRGLTRARATASWSDRPATLKYERKNAYGQVCISHVVERPEGFRSDGRDDAGFNLFHGRHYALQSTIKRPRWRPLCFAVSRPLIAGNTGRALCGFVPRCRASPSD